MFWKTIKLLNKCHSQSPVPVLTQVDTQASSDEEKANMMGDFFSTCFNDHVPKLDSALHEPCETDYDILCTVEQVQYLLCSLDVTKATGPDGISARMLRETANTISPSVTDLFKLSLSAGCVPADWKKSKVVPIPKIPHANSPNEFRPISLLSVLSKCLERHVHTVLILLYSHHFQNTLG